MKFPSIILVSLLLASCSEFAPEDTGRATEACYQNVFGTGDAKDIEFLVLGRIGSTVEGEFNWLPAFKDRRTGSFSGREVNGVIEVSYEFTQEGQQSTVQLELVVKENSILVSGGDPALGLNRELPSVACGDIKSLLTSEDM